jgi:hypothetical protein
MSIQRIQSYLVEPGKGLEKPRRPNGVEIRLVGALFNMLTDIYNKSDKECSIPICFLPTKSGAQENEMRSLLIKFCASPEQANGLPIAERLGRHTTHRSKLGLLFLIIGHEKGETKLLISRFPAEKGIIADVESSELRVEYIEKVFMKSAMLYKAALYQAPLPKAGFWSGYATDKQINSANYDIAQYWIQHFLQSEYKTTSKAGSKRIALAIRKASQSSDKLSVKRELSELSNYLIRAGSINLSLNQVFSDLRISGITQKSVLENLTSSSLADEVFQFDSAEFHRHNPFKSIELNSGGILTAPTEKFDECFSKEELDSKTELVKFTAEGRIVDEKLKGRR